MQVYTIELAISCVICAPFWNAERREPFGQLVYFFPVSLHVKINQIAIRISIVYIFRINNLIQFYSLQEQ